MSDETILSTLIPEVQHDLIARLIPGILLVSVLLWRYGFFSLVEIKAGLATLLIMLIIVAGYCVSLLLTPFSGFLNSLCRRRRWSKSVSHSKLIYVLDDKFDLDLPRNSKKEIEIDELELQQIAKLEYLTNDYLKEEDDYAGVILPKMCAEAELCANLSIALIVLAVFLGPWLSQGAIELSWVSCLVLLPVSLVATWHRNKRLIARQHSYLDLILGMGTGSDAVSS